MTPEREGCEPIPSDADIIRRVGFLRYQELRDASRNREPITHRAYWGPDYEPREEDETQA